MRILTQDLWTVRANFLCITTNSTTYPDILQHNQPAAVMGAGCALEAKLRFPGIEFELGAQIKEKGNHVHILGAMGGRLLLSFPVKEHWSKPAQLWLIEQSCRELKQLLAMRGCRRARVVIPRPGCGRGNLDWYKQVRPILHRHFWNSPNILIVHKQETLQSKHTSEP